MPEGKFEVPREIRPEQFDELVVRGNMTAMVFVFSPSCENCREYAPYAVAIADCKKLPGLQVFSIDGDRYPNFQREHEAAKDERFVFFRNGKMFDTSPLNRRGVKIILDELFFEQTEVIKKEFSAQI